MNAPTSITPPYKHTPLFPLGADKTAYRELDIAGANGGASGVRIENIMGEEVIVVGADTMRALAEEAFNDINH